MSSEPSGQLRRFRFQRACIEMFYGTLRGNQNYQSATEHWDLQRTAFGIACQRDECLKMADSARSNQVREMVLSTLTRHPQRIPE